MTLSYFSTRTRVLPFHALAAGEADSLEERGLARLRVMHGAARCVGRVAPRSPE